MLLSLNSLKRTSGDSTKKRGRGLFQYALQVKSYILRTIPVYQRGRIVFKVPQKRKTRTLLSQSLLGILVLCLGRCIKETHLCGMVRSKCSADNSQEEACSLSAACSSSTRHYVTASAQMVNILEHWPQSLHRFLHSRTAHQPRP